MTLWSIAGSIDTRGDPYHFFGMSRSQSSFTDTRGDPYPFLGMSRSPFHIMKTWIPEVTHTDLSVCHLVRLPYTFLCIAITRTQANHLFPFNCVRHAFIHNFMAIQNKNITCPFSYFKSHMQSFHT